MDKSAERTRVEWREWSQDAFDDAARAGKPVLLSLSATWCAHCHEMDRETYDEPRMAANVNDGFVPIRVDVDRRPRVRERYNMGGFPSTVFLAPDGTVLSGAGYLAPDGFRQVLSSVRKAWDAKGQDAGTVPRSLRDGTPPAGALTPEVEKQMLGQLVDAFDADDGGWGEGAKFPLPRTVEFALKRERDQAVRTLDAVDANLRDDHDGGFYRFAENANWSTVHHEKLLDSNAALVRAFANAYLYTGTESYRDAARSGVEYLASTLWTGEAFAGSQADDDEYYALDPSDRETAEAPAIDGTAFADRNALAADALLTFASYTDDEHARKYGRDALAFVRDDLVADDGAVTHYRVDGETGERGVLADQAHVLSALLRARQVLGADAVGGDVVDAARAVADWTIDALGDEDAFRDGPASGAGLLDEPLYPLDGNVALADALLDLAVVTGDDEYRARGRRALEAFGGAADRFGVRVATYAAAASRYLESPLVIRVGDDAGSDLHRAALRMADHEKVVVPAASDVPAGEATVARGDDVAGTATTPPALADLVAETV
ncbi:thioredoxin domain-containing protein [Halorubellus sp. JP-L1]|uniref:DUF255 domain-containing protein n=1 Tax=Halorubellus sp. JP-L1 TaxID=2715753 RepID=UPI001409D6CF|nr:DUF255 domain-containing protein [Halorubellus sp. JP-L1]NHN41294.1 thioredoxin domain-containing protein [Halorubellus sp. JP-L1]